MAKAIKAARNAMHEADKPHETKSREVKSEPKQDKIAPAGDYEVAQEFRDIVDFSIIHHVGENANGFDQGRLNELIEGGLVRKKVAE